MSRAIDHYLDRERPVTHHGDDMADETIKGATVAMEWTDEPPVWVYPDEIERIERGAVSMLRRKPSEVSLGGVKLIPCSSLPPGVLEVQQPEGSTAAPPVARFVFDGVNVEPLTTTAEDARTFTWDDVMAAIEAFKGIEVETGPASYKCAPDVFQEVATLSGSIRNHRVPEPGEWDAGASFYPSCVRIYLDYDLPPGTVRPSWTCTPGMFHERAERLTVKSSSLTGEEVRKLATVGPILVVEDDRRACSATMLGLRPLGLALESLVREDPYQAALDAIKRITNDPPGIVVVDGLEGYGALVADVAITEGVPVVAYTGEPGRFRRLGLPIVVKPEADELVLAVRRALLEVDHG